MKTLFITIALLFGLSACSLQNPVDQATSVDTRPGINFDLPSGAKAKGLDVYVDGLNMGPVKNYVKGHSVLRIIKGTHVIKVMRGTEVVSEQEIYLGDSQTRTIPLNL